MLKNTIKVFQKSKALFNLQYMNFRDYRDKRMIAGDRYQGGRRMGAYSPEFVLTEAEKEENEKLPVSERILDWEKYMKHKGQLKYTTTQYMVDVEPFPRLKIMMLCDIIMNFLKKLPEDFMYRHLSYENTKYIMKVVDETESIYEIEEKLTDVFSAEHLIFLLHNEASLLKNLIEWEPWKEQDESYKDFDKKEFFFMAAAFRDQYEMNYKAKESSKHAKTEKPSRPDTAGFYEREDQI